MFALILEVGMDTVSCCAWFALRTRDSMSAIGSVMVIVRWPFAFLVAVPVTHLRFPCDFGRLTLPSVSTGGRSLPFDAYTGRLIWRGAYNKVDVLKSCS